MWEKHIAVHRQESQSTRSCSRIFVKLFFHSVSRLKRVALNVSACCSTLSLTIFQKQSLTAKLKLRVVVWVALKTPSLEERQCSKNERREVFSSYRNNFDWRKNSSSYFWMDSIESSALPLKETLTESARSCSGSDLCQWLQRSNQGLSLETVFHRGCAWSRSSSSWLKLRKIRSTNSIWIV